MYIYIYICMYVYIYIYTHTHTLLYRHTLDSPPRRCAFASFDCSVSCFSLEALLPEDSSGLLSCCWSAKGTDFQCQLHKSKGRSLAGRFGIRSSGEGKGGGSNSPEGVFFVVLFSPRLLAPRDPGWASGARNPSSPGLTHAESTPGGPAISHSMQVCTFFACTKHVFSNKQAQAVKRMRTSNYTDRRFAHVRCAAYMYA